MSVHANYPNPNPNIAHTCTHAPIYLTYFLLFSFGAFCIKAAIRGARALDPFFKRSSPPSVSSSSMPLSSRTYLQMSFKQGSPVHHVLHGPAMSQFTCIY